MRSIIPFLLSVLPMLASYPALRGTPTIQTSSSNPTTLTFPTGTVVGDLVIVIGANENNIFNIGNGWTVLQNFGGTSQISGAAWSKIMTSGDIATGSVNVTPNGTFPGVYAIVSVQGATQNGVRETDSSQFSSGATSRTITTSSSVTASDLGIYFGAVRVSTTPTISPGTLVGNPSGGVSGALYTQNIPSAGALTITYSYPSAGLGDVQFAIIIKPSSATPTGFTAIY